MTSRTYLQGSQPTLDELKQHLRITGTDMDAELGLKLRASIRSAEHYIGQIIAESVFVLTSSFSSAVALEGPVIGVSGVEVDGVSLDDSCWSLDGRILTIDAEGTALKVTYTAGLPSVDDDIKAAILLHAAALFSNPVDSVETLPKASSRLLDPYRTWGV